MTYHFDGYNYLVRLEKDELLIESLETLAKKLGHASVWVNGLGGAQWAELGFYDLGKKEYTWQRFDQLMEVTSLQGNLAWVDGMPVWHVHGMLSDAGFHALGGHIKELSVAGTCELLLHRIYGEAVTRFDDEATGLKLLRV